ncbi:hypothetical protein L226DRAFT_573722 [Lentinus tigrinus ALCF2SS1-7]|uniref:Uncharacterized protein n=1 Tax=Lentinus tigrinus ALCF2SS1-6 TaxID=1328759 RepID=A0A5C2S0T3_9APHY|nr:hypothetical protein L227DRAFT_552730 [Lentinus tigrinus ALCF2SS1-6]RPD71781.1 hypothetical protein L226DRAFT_573722 [Lentinus tigrinus ALCF2SS1-7]
MSLPQAQKDISDKPAAGSVVDPVNKKNQAADVDRKLRFYGVIRAFSDSRMPSNEQIDRALNYVLQNSPVDTKQLSPSGQRLIQDTRDIIDTARLIVQQKNADELFQNFIWHTRDVDFDQAKKDPKEVVPVDKEKAKSDGQQAVQHLRTLLSLVLTNAEVRKLLTDFSVIGRDILARTASKVADKARPDEERLRRIDESAPRDQFVTEGGRLAGPDETPVLEARIPGTDTTVAQHPREELGHGAKVTKENGEVTSGASAINETQQRTNETIEQGKMEAQRQKEDVNNVVGGNPVPDDREDAEAKKSGLMGKIRGVRDNLTDRVPQEHKDRVNEHYDRAKRVLTEEYFPEERRDQFIYRGKKVIVECQRHKDYQESMQWLLDFLEEYASHGKTVANHGKDSKNQLGSDGALNQATYELRTLLERFANGKSLGMIGDAMQTLYNDAQQDEELRNWFRSVDAYTRKVLLDPGFVLEPQCNNEANELRENGRRFYDEKYKGHFDNLFNVTTEWFRGLGEDPLNKRFGEDWARLTKDLLFDSEGSLKFKPDLWMDIRKVILPSIIDQVGYMPIPRVEYTDDQLDLVIENLALSGRNLFPNVVSMEAHNFIKFSPYNAIKDENHHEFTLTLGQIQADMRDVAFYFKKKAGFPKLSDSGLADVLLGGEGLTITAHVASADKDRSSVFKVKNVHVKVGTLKFSIRDSKHDLLYKTLRPLATGLVKKQLQKAIADAVTTGLEYVDGQLTGVRDRMAEAKASEDKSRTQVLQEMFQHKQEEALSVKSKADDKGSHFKIVSRRDSALLPQQGHPAGWVNRTQEREDAAMRGKDWRSDAFTIV